MTATEEAAAGKSRGRLRAKAVLISVIGLHLVAETALTPFLPQLFERLYGIEEPSATGLFIWIGRIVGLAALPLWGLAARRWPLHRLVLAGLCGSAVFDLLLGLAPSYTAFLVLSAGVVATNSAMLLAYPAFIAEHDDGTADGEGARLAGICSFVVVFHVSTVVSTLVGAGVLALPEPRVGISAFAMLDLLLAWVTFRVLGSRPAAGATPTPDASGPAEKQESAEAEEGTAAGGEGTRPAASRAAWFMMLAQAALIGVAFDFSVNVARPFFTQFAESLDSGSTGSAVLFFLPSAAALAVLPAARRCHTALGDKLLPLSMAVGAAGLAWQAYVSSLPELAAGRVLFGIGLGLGQVAVELRAFRATGTAGPAFTAVETVRSAGLLAAPLVASATVSHDLALPLIVAAAVQVAATALSLRRMRVVPAPAPKLTPAAAGGGSTSPRELLDRRSTAEAAAQADGRPLAAVAHSEENHR